MAQGYPVSEQTSRTAEQYGLGPYEGGAVTPRRIPWKWLVISVVLLVTGVLGLTGLVEMESTRQGEIDTPTLLLGLGIGGTGLAVVSVWYLRQRRAAIQLYRNGFIVDYGSLGGVVFTYESVLGHVYRGKRKPDYYVRTDQQSSWTLLPEVQGIEEIGPAIMARAGTPG